MQSSLVKAILIRTNRFKCEKVPYITLTLEPTVLLSENNRELYLHLPSSALGLLGCMSFENTLSWQRVIMSTKLNLYGCTLNTFNTRFLLYANATLMEAQLP